MENLDKVVRYFGKPSEFWECDQQGRVPSQWEPISRFGQERLVGPAHVFIGDISPGENLPKSPRSPDSIHGIHFEGIISQPQFEILLSPLANLTTLDLHLCSLSQLTLKQSRHFSLDLLRNLQISSTNFSSRDAQNHDMELVLENAMTLINLRFPKVKYFGLSVPNLSWMESAWTSAIVRSLIRNKSGLKYLNLESPFSLAPHHHDSSQYPKFECPREVTGDLQALALTSFHYSAMMETESTSFWREFSLGQFGLEYFHFWVQGRSAFRPASLEEILRNNRGTVDTVAVNNLVVPSPVGLPGTEAGAVISGRALQHCTKLRTLYLMGDIEPEESPQGQSHQQCRPLPSFSDFNLLPYSLEILRLRNLTLTMRETKFISHNLQNLTHLELVNIGEEGNLGMNLENLPTLLSKKKIEGVEVVRGFNKGTLQVSPEDKGWKNIAKILFQKQTKSWFRAAKDPGGKTFNILQFDSEEEESNLTDDSDSDSNSSSLETLSGDRKKETTGRHEIHSEETSRILNSDARKLYANLKFNLGTSSDELNQNKP